MKNKRAFADSIVLDNDKIWILGGSDGTQGSRLSSTEYIYSDGRTEEGPPMPIALSSHSVLKINQSTSFLVGGYVGSSDYIKKTWYFNGEWSKGPDLRIGRSGHSLGIVRDSATFQEYLVVAGGYDGSYNLSDVEILSVNGNAWVSGKLL